MAKKMITINDLPSMPCRRLLAGTLYTAGGIGRQVLITAKGSSLTLEPFACETHSTIFASRAALVDSRRIADIPTESLSIKDPDIQYRALAKALTDNTSSDSTVILSLDPGPSVINPSS